MSPRKRSVEIAERIGVIYARYSSHNQKEESIEQQVEECMAFAALNHIKIIQVYSDKALSGKTDKRPQFQKMMRDAEKRQFTVVVAYKSNRIARNMLNALSYWGSSWPNGYNKLSNSKFRAFERSYLLSFRFILLLGLIPRDSVYVAAFAGFREGRLFIFRRPALLVVTLSQKGEGAAGETSPAVPISPPWPSWPG